MTTAPSWMKAVLSAVKPCVGNAITLFRYGSTSDGFVARTSARLQDVMPPGSEAAIDDRCAAYWRLMKTTSAAVVRPGIVNCSRTLAGSVAPGAIGGAANACSNAASAIGFTGVVQNS